MRTFKILLIIVVLVIAVGVGVFAYFVNNLNGIVENVIESEGPKITQTEVNVGDVDITLRQGRGVIRELSVTNPSGFDSADASNAEQLVLQIQPSSVLEDVIVINEVVVEGVTITTEQKGLTTNIQELLKSIRESVATEQPAAESESDVRLMIERISFTDSQMQLITEEHGDYQLDFPNLELTDIGTREEGLAPAELGRAILEPLLAQARRTAQERLGKAVRQEAESRLKDKAQEKLGDDAEEKLRELKGLLN